MSVPSLNLAAVSSARVPFVPPGLSADYPVRILQVGSGNFLRAFTAWMVHEMNRQGLFCGQVAITSATPNSATVATLRRQDHLYTVLQRGLHDGELIDRADLVSSIAAAFDLFAEWQSCRELMAEPRLRFVVSNTTEAGIAWREQPPPEDACPATFPAQVAVLLHARWRAHGGSSDAGLVFLPCELIEHNGDTLRDLVLRHVRDWGWPGEFAAWIASACRFHNTLVDRIVPGFPGDESDALAERLGYRDNLLVAAELYHSWVIEDGDRTAAELPLAEAGINVTWTRDVRPYRERKVRILNGVHTMMVPVAFLAGIDTVREAVEHPVIAAYVRRGLFDEILPTLDLPPGETRRFAESTLERFANPTIRHRLLSIALNTTSKWRVRVLPSLMDAMKRSGNLPPALSFSLAATLALYRGRRVGAGLLEARRGDEPYQVRDDDAAVAFFSERWSRYNGTSGVAGLVAAVLSERSLWNQDLTAVGGLAERVAVDLQAILRGGMLAAVQRCGSNS